VTDGVFSDRFAANSPLFATERIFDNQSKIFDEVMKLEVGNLLFGPLWFTSWSLFIESKGYAVTLCICFAFCKFI